ncbi:import component protein [Pedobacter yulinensis]|uniref:Import component protein n=1 Tax=Pedobacter yulinensis TaxID=2126353 RepID=A0A2T3HHW8_9SPHI|nr:import component protein [Pedobacter yulinensis]PST82035.1 import component protein [Pedobacter yulinensis]
MKNKTLAILAYVTIIGWIISYLEFKKRTDKDTLVSYHLEQSLGLIILSLVLGIASSILVSLVPPAYIVSIVVSLGTFVLLLLGIIAANNEARKPLPVVGKMFEGKFDFLRS